MTDILVLLNGEYRVPESTVHRRSRKTDTYKNRSKTPENLALPIE